MSAQNLQSQFPNSDILPELTGAFRISPVKGFDRGPSVFRFDPSGILKINGAYHVYYTRFSPLDHWSDLFQTPNQTQIWLATSEDGWHWKEAGQVLEDSPSESWHRTGKHAPHVIHVNDMFYLFYTAHVGPEYHNKRIGLAMSDTPTGPFRHTGDGPLMDAGPEVFDSVGQDDSCVLQRDNKFWWYFKGYGTDPRTGRPINNRLCLATADAPHGPYTRSDQNPVTLTHTGCVWPHGSGLAMISDAADTSKTHPYPPCIQYSQDGTDFVRGAAIRTTTTDDHIRAEMDLSMKHWGIHLVDPGVYCPLISNPDETDRGISWGLSQLPDGIYAPNPEGPHWFPFIVRFDCDLQTT